MLLSYGKALISLTATLRTADAQKDSTLATVILMSMYEVGLSREYTSANYRLTNAIR